MRFQYWDSDERAVELWASSAIFNITSNSVDGYGVLVFWIGLMVVFPEIIINSHVGGLRKDLLEFWKESLGIPLKTLVKPIRLLSFLLKYSDSSSNR